MGTVRRGGQSRGGQDVPFHYDDVSPRRAAHSA